MPESIPSEQAPLFLPISNGIEWVRRYGRLEVGGTVVVLGPGQHGLGCVIGAREAGAGLVIVSGRSGDTRRLDLAMKLGADHVVNVDEEHLVRRVRELTEGAMADVVVDTTHRAPQALSQAIDVAASGAVVVAAGLKMGPVEFPSDKIITKDLTIRGANGHDLVGVSAAIKVMAANRYPLHEMCSHTFGLGQVAEAVQTVGGEGESDPVHVTVMPGK